jgi:hypothetical protein
MLRIYTEFELFPAQAGLFPLLLPFAPQSRLPPADTTVRASRFEALEQSIPRWFTLGTKDDADIAALPIPWSAIRGNAEWIERARRFARKVGDRPILIYDVSDLEDRIPIPNALVLRTSSRRSRQRPNEVVVPGWSEDLLMEHAPDALLRAASSYPTVSFCGLAEPLRPSLLLDSKAMIIESADALGLVVGNYGNQVRRAAMLRLLRSKTLRTAFTVKDQFFGGAQMRSGIDPTKAAAARREFVASVVGSDYVLCVRGAGNYSFRFFETLCLGRIPVVVDTDSVFPLEHRIDPRSFSVWVPRSELHRIDQLVVGHFESIRGRFAEELARLRALWLDWYSPSGFFAAFAQDLRRRLGRW